MIVLGWALGAGVLAQEPSEDLAPGEAPVEAAQVGPNFLVAVEDRRGLYESDTFVFRVEAPGEAPVDFLVLDNGTGNDPEAGDHRFTGEISTYPAGLVTVRLLDEAELELWSAVDFSVSDAQLYPALRLRYDGALATGGLVEDEPVGRGPAAGSELDAYELEEMAGLAGRTGLNPKSWLTSLFLVAIFGAVLGLLYGMYRWANTRRRVLLQPGSAVPGSGMSLEARVMVWRVPDRQARCRLVSETARQLAPLGPVLVVPDPQNRGALRRELGQVPGVAWPRGDRPEVGRIVRWIQELMRPSGASVVLVDGLGALEPPLPGEEVSDVVEELVDRVAFPLVLLLHREEVVPLEADRVFEGP